MPQWDMNNLATLRGYYIVVYMTAVLASTMDDMIKIEFNNPRNDDVSGINLTLRQIS